MKSTLSQLSRRTFGMAALAAAATPLLSACGGGGDTTSATYNDRTPGTVPMTVTHKVTMTVSMPDLTGVTNPSTLDQAGYDALPMVTKTINLGLDHTHAPLSTENFLAYLNAGTYLNTIFHRVVPTSYEVGVVNGSLVQVEQFSIVQGGGFTDANGTLTAVATKDPIALESRNGLANTRGTLGMARTTEANSATSQFYINRSNVNASYFDYVSDSQPGYAVFGTVLDADSMATVDAIAQIRTNDSQQPLRDVTITAISVVSLL
ncbi:peptidylprolyl isomerase [Pelomonas sp. KK5]|uniref:peptidylprolyl isomerase n=1 Tax=Pelomonas sp. KK5 TaxID=1855730 RepID=UPI00097CB411|nr:peptidylprolyl isomerase [Pelomonas sp. KK5]